LRFRRSTTTVPQIKFFCFAASYSVAFALELLYQFWPRRGVRAVSLAFGFAGLVAQTIFLVDKQPAISRQYGLLLFLAWVLAIFYLIGSLHHVRIAWGVFVLPLILALIGLGRLFDLGPDTPRFQIADLLSTERAWDWIHGGLLFLAAVGVCVAFFASLMYLFQARRLRYKTLPTAGFRLLSLERLEAMNRRAMTFAFPLLTIGMLIGGVLMYQNADTLVGWHDPRVLTTVLLWLAFAVMLYVRYGMHLAGRQVALLTIVTFALFVVCLLLPHPDRQGGAP
jgi:ABC-type transport system involved in cytochrome c biogenesis permease subunit